ncbi:MAG TPA: hypothetical protein VJ826_11140 [Candidatus Polarisedimenticolaceae bacterium]|nr:hypothetical protein [Candidatus Polarisedimenticolaceae bacterium]
MPTLLLALILASYMPSTGTKLEDSWKSPDVERFRFKKILVVAVAKDPSMRRDAEERLREIVGKDRTVASMELFPKVDPPPEREAAKAKIAEAGCDGVVLMRAVSSTAKSSPIPGRINYDPAYDYFWGGSGYGYWGTVYTTRWSEGYEERDTAIKVETLVYDLAKDKLVWSGVSNTKNPGSVRNLVLAVADAVGKQMKKEKLIAK